MLFADAIVTDPVTGLGLLSGAGMVIALLFNLLIKSKDREHASIVAEKDRLIVELVSEKKSNKEIRDEALRSALDQANYARAKDGKPPIIPVAPVISESHSPSTQAQRDTAEIATARATLALIKLETGQTPRTEPEQAIEAAANGGK